MDKRKPRAPKPRRARALLAVAAGVSLAGAAASGCDPKPHVGNVAGPPTDLSIPGNTTPPPRDMSPGGD